MDSNLDRKKAIAILWNKGVLTFKLDKIQKELYQNYLDSTHKTVVWSCSRRLGKCLAEGTEVMTPQGPVPIEQLKEGDTVYGYNRDGSVSPTKVRAVFDQGIKEVVQLNHGGKVVVESTLDHVWLVKTRTGKLKEKKLSEFLAGDRIVRKFVETPLKTNYVGVLLGSTRKVRCWDISVDNETSLYLTAGGLVTHNSWTLCVVAVEQCLKKPNTIVKYVAPQQKMVKTIVRPILRDILKDCPKELRPEYKTNDHVYRFPNGSEIQIAGADSGHAESLRGGSAHLCIVDEAGFIDDLRDLVQSILIPTTTTTRGKIILSSTPPKSPGHSFCEYLKKAEYQGTLIKKTIYDNPRLSPDQVKEIEDEYGVDSIEFRREFMCVDAETLIRTPGGYKEIQDISPGEDVLAHDGQFRRVKHHFVNPRGGRKMYKLTTSNKLGQVMTEGHKLLVTRFMKHKGFESATTSWEEIDKIKEGPSEQVYIRVPVSSNNVDTIDERLAYLAGWYVAEGHCTKLTQNVTFSLGNHDPASEISAAAEACFGKKLVSYGPSPSGGCTQYHLLSKEAKDFFKQFGRVSYEKKVPEWLKQASEQTKRAFLRGYFSGDGSECPKKRTLACVSNSLQLICGISDLLLSLGISNSVRKNKPAQTSTILGRQVNQKAHYGLTINGKNYQRWKQQDITARHEVNIMRDGYLYSRIIKIEEIPYDKELVHDLEVEGAHSYVGLHCTFHNCEQIVDENVSVVPEFTEILMKEVTQDWKTPPFRDCYVSGDIGFKDLTVFLFAYYDFKSAKLIVQDELVMSGKKMTTEALAASIKAKEEALWTNPVTHEFQTPYLRVCDNNLIVINDLHRLHRLVFVPTQKDDKEAALNNMRILLKEGRIVIHPRCKTLLFHLRNATWAKSRKTYERSPDAGHYDAVDALLYLVRNVVYSKNPYPAHYGRQGSGDDWHTPEQNTTTVATPTIQAIQNIFKPRFWRS